METTTRQATRTQATHIGTLLDLVIKLTDAGDAHADETALEMLKSGAAILTGNFKGHDWTPEAN